MGPGKPYWKSPEGSTGGWRGWSKGDAPGTGAGGVTGVEVLWPGMEVVATALPFRDVKKAAVTAALVAAETPATMARVVFDIMGSQEWSAV